jgi:hypothetical protein
LKKTRANFAVVFFGSTPSPNRQLSSYHSLPLSLGFSALYVSGEACLRKADNVGSQKQTEFPCGLETRARIFKLLRKGARESISRNQSYRQPM